MMNPDIQRVTRYNSIPTEFPMTIPQGGHARISDLNLHWTHTGEWAKIPRNRDQRMKKGDNDYDIVRVESYIDEEGQIRKAVCYTTQDTDMKVWFKFEEMMLTHPHWEIPKPSIFFNGRKWKPDPPTG